MRFFRNQKNFRILLLLIILLAAFFRFYKIGEVPPPLYPDEAMYAQDGLKIALSGEFKVYYPANYGREGLFMWILAFFFKIFGPSLIVFKSVVGIFGLLTIWGIYLLGKEAFSQKVGLLSAFFASFSFWAIHFSRIGFRADLVPFFVTFALYFFVKGLKKKEIKDFVFGGIFLGLGFYTYLAFRLIVLAGFLFLIYLYFFRKEIFKENFKGILSFLLVGFLVALPAGIYFFKNPQDFIGRATGVSVMNFENPFFEFLKSFVSNFLSFFAFGDKNWRHNFSSSSHLIFPISLFFACGLFCFFKKTYFSLKDKKENPFFALFSFLFLSMMLPAALAAEGNPHLLRLIGNMSAVFIISGFGFFSFYEFFLKKIGKEKFKNFFKKALIFILIILPFFEFFRYFFVYAKKPQVYGEFTNQLANIASYYNSLEKNWEKYVICNLGGLKEEGVPISAQTIKFLTYGKSDVKYINREEVDEIKTDDFQNKDVVFALMLKDEEILSKLNEKFPYNSTELVNIKPGTNSDFYILKVKGGGND